MHFEQPLQYPGRRNGIRLTMIGLLGRKYTYSISFPEDDTFLCIISSFPLFDLGPLGGRSGESS